MKRPWLETSMEEGGYINEKFHNSIFYEEYYRLVTMGVLNVVKYKIESIPRNIPFRSYDYIQM